MASDEYSMKYHNRKTAIVLLADGSVFYGKAIGNTEGSAFGEISFNTAATGYQEFMTDPSSRGQIMIHTGAHVGGYGVSKEEMESDAVQISGLVVRNFAHQHSREAAEGSLEDFVNEHQLLVVSDVDTRALTQHIRDNGAMKAVVSTEVNAIERLKSELNALASENDKHLVKEVSTTELYSVGDSDAKYKVAVLDLGVKKSVLNQLVNRDCFVEVYPYNSSIEVLQNSNADGYFISNGPGNPEILEDTVELVKQIIALDKPVFGICLGHQLLALANGLGVTKLKNGHRGVNHPVKNLNTGRGEVTTQNNAYVVDEDSLANRDDILVTHRNLNDDTVAGIRMKDKLVASVHYQAGAKPGPEDSFYLYDEFIQTLEKSK